MANGETGRFRGASMVLGPARGPTRSRDVGGGRSQPMDSQASFCGQISGFMKLTKDQRLAVLVLVAVFLFNVYRFLPVFTHSHS
jgi:hypothetical protein